MEIQQWFKNTFQTKNSFKKQILTIILFILPTIIGIFSFPPMVLLMTASPFITIIIAAILYNYEYISLYTLTVINDLLWFLFNVSFVLLLVEPSLDPNNPEILLIGQYILNVMFLIVLTVQIRAVIMGCLLINMIWMIRCLSVIGQSLTLIQLQSAILIGGVLLQLLLMDIEMEKTENRQEAYELSVVKIIHDLKNPVLSILQVLKDETDCEVIKEEVTTEANECLEMLHDLNISFKVRKGMEIKEEPTQVNLKDFTRNLCKAHSNLSENCKNKLEYEIELNENDTYMIQKTLVKRIMHNFISNSLKHTRNGVVKVKSNLFNLNSEDFKSINSRVKNNEMYIVGSDFILNQSQIKFEVEDTGQGIHPDVIGTIFDEMQTDQRGDNWEGCGLGLSICKAISLKINACIVYSSSIGVGSSFTLQVPIELNSWQTSRRSSRRSQIEENLMLKARNNHVIEQNKFSSSITLIPIIKIPECQDLSDNSQNKLNTIKVIESKGNNNHNEEISNNNMNHSNQQNTKSDKSQFINSIDQNNPTYLHNFKVVIAEDSRVLGKTQRKYFDKVQIPQTFCTDGKECLEYLIENVNNYSNFLLFTDNQMPHMSGIEMSKELRKMNFKCHIILISADDIQDRDQIFDKVQTKPVPLSTFKQEQQSFQMKISKLSKNEDSFLKVIENI